MASIVWDSEFLARVNDLEWASRILVEGYLQGLHRSPLRGFSVEFADRKPYSQGDDTRFLDWHYYGRSDRFYIRQFESETNLSCQLILDGSGSMRYQSGSSGFSKYQYGALLCAGMSRLLNRSNDACGLSVVGGPSALAGHLPPRIGRTHFERVLTTLERHDPQGEGTIAGGLSTALLRLHQRSLVVVMTDTMEDAEPLAQALKAACGGLHEIHLWVILDPTELSFAFTDNQVLEDLETGVRLPVSPGAVRQRYLEALEAHQRRIIDICHDTGVYLHQTVTSEAPFAALRSIFNSAPAVRRG